MQPVVLDLGCGAGGVSTGYRNAGYLTIGVDIEPQPHYPFEFIQADMLDVADHLIRYGRWRGIELGEIDLVHVSAPCQRWSKQLRCRPELKEKYPDLITPMRPLLEEAGKPYVMENVEGAPLRDPVMLCGTMFRRELYRHRLLETGNGISLPQLPHPRHAKPASRAGHWVPGTVMSISGHIAPVAMARELMGIDWTTREELAEAIPVYFSEWAGLQIRSQLLAAA
jgi:DNA (cytosine-5)-methyltransferase 1